ncbi:MAG: ATP-binding protein, partial [Chloroflexi bacterium]|nr:ATP-binding protein [Chloroflexota bacterium]
MSRIPLRLQLAAVYGLILGVALALAAILVYALLESNLVRELDDTLSVRSAALHRALNVTDEGFDVQHLTAQSLQVPVNEFAAAGVYIEVLDQHGNVAAASANLQDQRLPIDPAVIADGLGAKPTLVSLPVGRGLELRVMTTPMIHGERVVGLLQVAASLSTIASTLRTLSYQLALGVIGTWLLALLLSWWVIGRALRPVAVISATAERIAATGDVGQRITYRGARDALGDLAATFNHMLDRIERSFAAHRHFVADSSHQLGTPLTVIRGNAELLGRALSPADREECVAAIKVEVERMDKIVGDLLTLAQLEARPANAFRKVRLDSLAEQVAAEARSLAGERRIVVESTVPVAVMGDPDRLSDLLSNLLHNAVKYSADGTTITVRVESLTDARALAGAKGVARLLVADEGIGIPEGDLEHVFDRFYRVD